MINFKVSYIILLYKNIETIFFHFSILLFSSFWCVVAASFILSFSSIIIHYVDRCPNAVVAYVSINESTHNTPEKESTR